MGFYSNKGGFLRGFFNSSHITCDHMSETQITRIKCVLVGDISVGKTSLRKRLVSETFSDNYLATLGVDFATKKFNIDDQICELQIWDIAGQPNYHSVAERFLRNSDGAILVYDVSNPSSFEHLKGRLSSIQELNVDEEPVFLVVGNKIDLQDPKMGPDEINGYFVREGFDLKEPVQTMYASAKTGENVENVFRAIAKKALKRIS